ASKTYSIVQVLGIYNTVCLVDRGCGLVECGSGPWPELPRFKLPPGRLRNSCARPCGPKARPRTAEALHPWLQLKPGASENRPPPLSTRQTCIPCDEPLASHGQPHFLIPMTRDS